MAQMVGSVNINTEVMENFVQTHVDDDDQPLFGDMDIWFQETLKPIRVPFSFLFHSCQHATAKASEQVDQKIERVSQPESILTGGEQRNTLLAQALEHWSITTSTGYQQTDTAILDTSIYKTSTEYQQLDTTILGDMHTPMDGCISLDVLSI